MLSTSRVIIGVTTTLVAALSLTSCANPPSSPATPTAESTSETEITSTPLLDAVSSTILDQQIVYPGASQAQVSSSIITLPPGVETGLHEHDAPMYAYILDGELTVEYAGGVTKVYTRGQAIMEAFETPHNGKNTGDNNVRVLVVNIGADGVANTVKLP